MYTGDIWYFCSVRGSCGWGSGEGEYYLVWIASSALLSDYSILCSSFLFVGVIKCLYLFNFFSKSSLLACFTRYCMAIWRFLVSFYMKLSYKLS